MFTLSYTICRHLPLVKRGMKSNLGLKLWKGPLILNVIIKETSILCENISPNNCAYWRFFPHSLYSITPSSVLSNSFLQCFYVDARNVRRNKQQHPTKQNHLSKKSCCTFAMEGRIAETEQRILKRVLIHKGFWNM